MRRRFLTYGALEFYCRYHHYYHNLPIRIHSNISTCIKIKLLTDPLRLHFNMICIQHLA